MLLLSFRSFSTWLTSTSLLEVPSFNSDLYNIVFFPFFYWQFYLKWSKKILVPRGEMFAQQVWLGMTLVNLPDGLNLPHRRNRRSAEHLVTKSRLLSKRQISCFLKFFVLTTWLGGDEGVCNLHFCTSSFPERFLPQPFVVLRNSQYFANWKKQNQQPSDWWEEPKRSSSDGHPKGLPDVRATSGHHAGPNLGPTRRP